MKYLFAIFSFSFLFSLHSQTPSLNWVKQLGGSGNDGIMTLHRNGNNLYVLGWFEGIADVDPGVGVTNVTGFGQRDIFIAKYDLSGNLIWSGAQGGADQDWCTDMITDNAGNLYMTGFFNGTCDFNPGSGSFPLSATTNSTQSYICKLDPQGNFLWAKNFGGISYGYGSTSIRVNASGDCYVTGIFEGSSDFDPGAGTFNMSAPIANGSFVLKLDANGNFVWATQFTGSGSTQGVALDLDAGGNIYLAGNFYGVMDLDPGPGTFTASTSTMLNGSYLVKLNSSGNFSWGKVLPGWATTINMSAAGNIYLGGIYDKIDDFDPGPSTFTVPFNGWVDIYIVKLDNTGNFIWCDVFGGTEYDSPECLLTDAQENLYVSGRFRTTVDFDPGPGTNAFSTIGSGVDDGFVLRLSSAGQLHWAAHIQGNMVYCNSHTLDNSGGLYVGAGFANSADFDPGPGTQNLNAQGTFDGYFLKLQQSSTVGINTLVNDGKFNVYPNPFNAELHLYGLNAETTIELISVEGKVLLRAETKEKEINLNTENLPAGIYFLKISCKDGVSYQKVVK